MFWKYICLVFVYLYIYICVLPVYFITVGFLVSLFVYVFLFFYIFFIYLNYLNEKKKSMFYMFFFFLTNFLKQVKKSKSKVKYGILCHLKITNKYKYKLLLNNKAQVIQNRRVSLYLI